MVHQYFFATRKEAMEVIPHSFSAELGYWGSSTIETTLYEVNVNIVLGGGAWIQAAQLIRKMSSYFKNSYGQEGDKYGS